MSTPIIRKYPMIMRILHWFMAFTFIGLIAVGWYMINLPDDTPLKYTFYPWHKSFGMLMLFFVGFRILFLFFLKKPQLPDTLSALDKVLARVAHLSLYLLMIIVPLSGYLMNYALGREVFMFGINMPCFLETNKVLGQQIYELHLIVPYVLLGFIALHITGVLKHRLFDQSECDVLKRMI